MSDHLAVDERLKNLVERMRAAFADDLWGMVLFGSQARGEARSGSDCDVFVIISNLPAGPFERAKYISERLAPWIGANLVTRTKDEFERGFPSLYLDLALDGVILYDRDGYTERKLAKIRELTEEAGLVREKRPYGLVWWWRNPPQGKWRVDWSGVYGLS
jgi:predicted nucleotidyltransferase